MKKLLAIAAAIALIGVMAIGLVACNSNSDILGVYAGQANLADSASISRSDGKTIKNPSLKSVKGDYLNIDLGSVKKFNTVTLKEAGDSILNYSIWLSDSENSHAPDYRFVYESDKIGAIKSCYLGEQSARHIRIYITNCKNKFELTDVGVYNVGRTDRQNFRVNTYLTVESIPVDGTFNAAAFDTVTDIIFFGIAKLNGNGDIEFIRWNADKGIDENVGENYYKQRLDIVKSEIKRIEVEQGRKINIVADISLPADNAEKLRLTRDNINNTVANVKAFVDKFGFDGYDCDYEYPYNANEWKAYNEYLRRIDKAMPDKIISVATQSWALNFDKDVIDIIDRFEVMTYDMFDSDGYHSTFSATFEEVQKFINKGIDKSKLDIGLPFYSRPTDGRAYWGSYFEAYRQLGKFNNLETGNIVDHEGMPLSSPRYFNSFGMIQDKTSFAYDMGLGGMMIWHYACDIDYNDSSGLSLFKAINEVIEVKHNQ